MKIPLFDEDVFRAIVPPEVIAAGLQLGTIVQLGGGFGYLVNSVPCNQVVVDWKTWDEGFLERFLKVVNDRNGKATS